MKPYGLISDTHNHAWSAFSTTLPTGVNSRLQMTLEETARCASEVRKAGGDTIIHAGDLFHVRGSIAPSVLNPTLDAYKALINDGFKIVILAGNHDLEGKNAERISSAITSLEGVGCEVVNSWEVGLDRSNDVVFVPWCQNIDELKEKLEYVAPIDREGVDLIIHAPIDDVIPGLPPHGLTASYLGGLGYRRVFAGHYHHSKDFGNGVHSIGALTHLTWSDVGSNAGFLIVSGEEVKYRASHAPSFVEIDHSTDPEDIPLIVDGNYVRAKVNSAKSSDIESLRQYLTDSGARGVTIIAQKELSAPTRAGASIKAGASIETSVADYIKAGTFGNLEKLSVECQSILTEARSVA
jgi:DNA repair exonuclease SbcCD nuclease subunit